MNGTLWTIVTIGGPVLLGLALLYAVLSNRFRRNKAPREVTERAAKKLHEELDKEDKARDE